MYTLVLRQIKCLDIDRDHIFNITCFVKAVRHKHGILNIYFEQLNMDNLIFHAKLFYQNSAARFLPYVFDFKYNVCDWNQLMSSRSIMFRLATFVAALDKHSNNGSLVCPFNVSTFSSLTIAIKALGVDSIVLFPMNTIIHNVKSESFFP